MQQDETNDFVFQAGRLVMAKQPTSAATFRAHTYAGYFIHLSVLDGPSQQVSQRVNESASRAVIVSDCHVLSLSIHCFRPSLMQRSSSSLSHCSQPACVLALPHCPKAHQFRCPCQSMGIEHSNSSTVTMTLQRSSNNRCHFVDDSGCHWTPPVML